jgi:hypothetical protein
MRITEGGICPKGEDLMDELRPAYKPIMWRWRLGTTW